MNPQNVDPQALHAVMALLWLLPVFGLIFMAIIIIPYWMIWKKAGFSPWLSLLMLLPMVNFVMLYMLAFTEWRVAPVQPGMYAGGQGGGYPGSHPGSCPRV